VAPGTIFALFAGIYFWFPKMTGRRMNECLGKIHFWGSFICMNLVFFPMLIQGLAGMNRRMSDGGATYAHNEGVLYLNVVISIAAWVMFLFQIPFIINLFRSIKKGKVAKANEWDATTLEWAAASSPPLGHGNFEKVPQVYREAYEYSVPGHDKDFYPQCEK
jgi:cytochrome c oxidase subunit 1